MQVSSAVESRAMPHVHSRSHHHSIVHLIYVLLLVGGIVCSRESLVQSVGLVARWEAAPASTAWPVVLLKLVERKFADSTSGTHKQRKQQGIDRSDLNLQAVRVLRSLPAFNSSELRVMEGSWGLGAGNTSEAASGVTGSSGNVGSTPSTGAADGRSGANADGSTATRNNTGLRKQ